MTEKKELAQSIALWDAIMLNAGSMIGSGIYIVPAAVAGYLQGSVWIMTAWVVGGLVSMLGALCLAELGAMMPKAGGIYIYLSRAFSPMWGFLYGWANFAVIMTGSIAAVAVGFATYLGYFIPFTPDEIKAVAIASIIFLTAINVVGILFGVAVQNFMTLLKIVSLGILIIIPIVVPGGSVENFTPLFSDPNSGHWIGAFGLATIAVLWAFDGWIEITYVAGEVRDPQKNVPRALVVSTVLIIGLYVLINMAYLYVLPADQLRASSLVASDMAKILMGPEGAAFVAGSVMISMFGANNGFVLSGARIYYAMAREGRFFEKIGDVHPRFGTPAVSIIAQGVWSCGLVFTGTFEQLTTYVVFASWFFYAMACMAVIVLRKKDPQTERPYRAWGYPWTPIVFIAFAAFLIGNAVMEDLRSSLIGVGIIITGLPLYGYWNQHRSR
ncbi:MAG TPA: amino acid permease [bacterium]|nr:amino acid permease [bacterium]